MTKKEIAGRIVLIVIISLIASGLCLITGVLFVLFTGYKAEEHSEVLQCLVWAVNILVCILIVGLIAIAFLRIKRRVFWSEKGVRKLIYGASFFGLTYTFSVLWVSLRLGYFDGVYATTYLSVVGTITIISAIIGFVFKHLESDSEKKRVEVKVELTQTQIINNPSSNKKSKKKKRNHDKKRK